MEAFYLSSPPSSFLPRTRRLCFVVSKHRLCLPLRINNMVYCQGGGSNIVTTGRAVDQASKAAALMEAGSLLLAPNGNAQAAAASSASASASAAENVGMKELVSSYVEKHEDGIGIVRFLRGKSFLITGGTGFLGKVLIEKILRTVPDVHKIYILIKADNKEVAMERLKKEIISAELFKFLKQTYGKSYQVFMLSKLVPVVGNVCESDLGIDDHTAEMIAKEVDIIVNSAANTTFDERYDVALDINTGGPNRLMKFAHQCHKLKLFLHVSTAYVNGQRQGKIIEKPFCIGESIAGESVVNGNQESSVPKLNVEDEMEMVLSAKQGLSDGAMAQKMKELGLERANKFGWQDTYVFTKAMGEMMIDNMRGNIPVVIVRPSVIESTHKEPFPGWMEGNRMMDPIILHYGKGQLTGFLVDPNGVLDVVPADMVVNATLAAMAKHGAAGKPGTSIYHIASSVVNPLVFDDLARLLYEHFQSKPYIDSKGKPIDVPRMKLFSSMEALSSHLWRDAIDKSGLTALGDSKGKLSTKLENICRKSVEQAKYLASIYEPYTFYGGRFDNSNAQKLMECMSKEERWQFGFEVESIDWKDYISNVHIPGLRRHVMKGRGSCS